MDLSISLLSKSRRKRNPPDNFEANLWRAIGQNPTEADLKRIIEENDTGTGHFQVATRSQNGQCGTIFCQKIQFWLFHIMLYSTCGRNWTFAPPGNFSEAVRKPRGPDCHQKWLTSKAVCPICSRTPWEKSSSLKLSRPLIRSGQIEQRDDLLTHHKPDGPGDSTGVCSWHMLIHFGALPSVMSQPQHRPFKNYKDPGVSRRSTSLLWSDHADYFFVYYCYMLVSLFWPYYHGC